MPFLLSLQVSEAAFPHTEICSSCIPTDRKVSYSLNVKLSHP
jgi:hypothetical protein